MAQSGIAQPDEALHDQIPSIVGKFLEEQTEVALPVEGVLPALHWFRAEDGERASVGLEGPKRGVGGLAGGGGADC